MNLTTFLLGALALAAGCLDDVDARAGEAKPPNFVFILVDDLGWADVGCFGSRYYQTPNIDNLAQQGMRFTDAYAACAVCSPTRASIMTGKYPARLHLTDWIPGEGNAPSHLLRVPEWRQFLPLEEITIPKALKSAGYVSASIGKWHLGGPKYYPEHQGFDLNVAGSDTGQPASYFWPYEGRTHSVPGLRMGGHEGQYLTDRLTDAAEEFITFNRDHPFFLYFAHYAVHTPLQGKPELVEQYKSRPAFEGQKNPVYAAMVQSVDESVGRILKKLELLGLAERTVVVFMSDNGGLWPQSTSNAPLRAGKGYAYEGGIREPLIIKWPGTTRSGAVCQTPVSSIDFFPTILDIAGVKSPSKVDGLSLVPLLQQSGPFQREALYWHYPHYWGGNRVTPFGAVRAGDWKLIEFYEDAHVELFNLKEDLGESHDLAAANRAKADQLRVMLHRWRQTVDAQMPSPNANYSPAAPDQTGPAFSDVFIAGKDGFNSIRIPSVVVTKSGVVLAIAEGRAAHADQANNKLILKRSQDGGRTWGGQQIIADDGTNCLNNPCTVIERAGGRIFVMFQSYPGKLRERDGKIQPGLDGPAIVRNYLIHSDDDGATWTRPLDVTRTTKHDNYVNILASGPGLGIQLEHGAHRGRLLIPFNEGPFGQWNVLNVYSDDRGTNWQLGSPAPGCRVPNPKGGEISLVNEVQFVELADGSVLLNSRKWSGAAVRKAAVSHDGGMTWSKIIEVPELRDPGCMASVFRYSFPPDGQKSRIIYSGPDSLSRSNGTVYVSYDEGNTWPVKKVLCPGSFAYSVLTRLADGTIGCLFETDRADRIAFARFNLAWLTDGSEH